MNERHLLDPTPELPDNTPIENIRFPTRPRNVLAAAGLKTVGEVRETVDKTLLSFQDLGPDSVAHRPAKRKGGVTQGWMAWRLIKIPNSPFSLKRR
jgi:DNA-directed RNA polymerase alpha subunit